MYSKEGWGCPPFLSYILDLFFFRSQDCILPGICFDALCNEKWFWNTQHFWKIVKSRKMQKHCKQKNKKLETQNTKRKTKNKTRTPNTNHKINKTAQTPGFDWFILPFLCFFLVNLHIECFLVIWCVLIVLFFVFQFLLKSNFSVETDVIVQGQMNGIVCVSSQIQPYLIIFTPDLIIFTPDMYSQDGGACPPLLSYILTFLFLLIGTILYIRRFCCSIVERDIQKELNGLLCESNQIQLFPSMPKV